MVELVAKTTPVVEGVSNAEEFIAYIARIGRVKENPERLIKFLLEHKHFSPFEHSYFTFKITTSRAIGRELLRHRSFTFQELSQRYEKVSVPSDFEIRAQAEKNRQSSTHIIEDSSTKRMIQNALQVCKDAYDKLLESGVARESARFILPGITESTILMTGNVRSWIHFLQLRLDEAAQKEVRDLAEGILEILKKELPLVYG